jgi:hypothetical protein
MRRVFPWLHRSAAVLAVVALVVVPVAALADDAKMQPPIPAAPPAPTAMKAPTGLARAALIVLGARFGIAIR